MSLMNVWSAVFMVINEQHASITSMCAECWWMRVCPCINLSVLLWMFPFNRRYLRSEIEGSGLSMCLARGSRLLLSPVTQEQTIIHRLKTDAHGLGYDLDFLALYTCFHRRYTSASTFTLTTVQLTVWEHSSILCHHSATYLA